MEMENWVAVPVIHRDKEKNKKRALYIQSAKLRLSSVWNWLFGC